METTIQRNLLKKLLVAAYSGLVVVAAAALITTVSKYTSGAVEITPLEVNAAHDFLTYVMIGAASVSFFALLFVDAPYGSIVFPLLIRGGKPTPLSIWLMAIVFTTWNGFLQGWQLAHRTPPAEPFCPRFGAGMTLWALGLAINIHSDHVLRTLRKPGETGYKIPRGGTFEVVSGANFLGEILEWCGFALAAWSLPTAAFALNTFCNLAPRAVSHHRWYKQKFEDYPKARKAIVPFLW